MIQSLTRPQDRPWNDPGPRRGRAVDFSYNLPTLKAIILDFSSVNNVDITSVQNLIDVRNQLDRYASPDKVDWHLACINNRWTKRALASAGFGYPTPDGDTPVLERWKPLFSVAEIGGSNSAAAAAQSRDNEKELRRQQSEDVEDIGSKSHGRTDTTSKDNASDSSSDMKRHLSQSHIKVSKVVAVNGLNRPLFHIDLTSALQSAVANVEAREQYEGKGVGTDKLT